MATRATKDAEQMLEAALLELESSKGSVASAVAKLQRAASVVGDHDTEAWCAIQLGDPKYTGPLAILLKLIVRPVDEKKEVNPKDVTAAVAKVNELGLKQSEHWTEEELILKYDEAGGGFTSMAFVEERYADLVRTKRGNEVAPLFCTA